jgi:hypothetical protein
MDNLLGELDEEDDENLQQINTRTHVQQEQQDDDMAFNKEDEINMKYNMSTNQVQKPKAESKKRPYQEISRANPFKKEESEAAAQQPEALKVE